MWVPHPRLPGGREGRGDKQKLKSGEKQSAFGRRQGVGGAGVEGVSTWQSVSFFHDFLFSVSHSRETSLCALFTVMEPELLPYTSWWCQLCDPRWVVNSPLTQRWGSTCLMRLIEQTLSVVMVTLSLNPENLHIPKVLGTREIGREELLTVKTANRCTAGHTPVPITCRCKVNKKSKEKAHFFPRWHSSPC